jgi:hypothetical protein
LGYEFVSIDAQGRVRELDPELNGERKQQYWLKLDDLAYDIRDLLVALESETAEQPSSSPGDDDPHKTVYLAQTSFDLQAEREAVQRDLQRRGYTVLPDRALPLSATELEPFVAEQMQQSRLAIHLIGANYGIIPEGASSSIVELQFDLTDRFCAADKQRLIWIPPGLQAQADNQRDFVERLRQSPGQSSTDLLELPLEDLKTSIFQVLEPPKTAPVRAVQQLSDDDELVRVYLICDERDLDDLAPLEDCLFEHEDFDVVIQAFDGDEVQLRVDHEENLRESDAILIYYGKGNELWQRRKLSELRKNARVGRTRPLLARTIYLAPPDSAAKQRLRTREATVIRQPEDAFDCAMLEPFFHDIDQARKN